MLLLHNNKNKTIFRNFLETRLLFRLEKNIRLSTKPSNLTLKLKNVVIIFYRYLRMSASSLMVNILNMFVECYN